MTDDTKQSLEIVLSLLKQEMKENGVILGLAVDKKDIDNSKVVFLDKEKYLSAKRMDGISFSLKDFNEDLI